MPASLEQRARAMDNAAEQAVARVVAPTPVRRSTTTQKQSGSNNKQSSTRQTPSGYSSSGNGQLVSNETGGIYYERHLNK